MQSQAADAENQTNSIVRPASAATAADAGDPELPRFFLDTKYVPPTSAPKLVASGGDLQAALNAAQPGDVITLQAGATFTGNFTLPAKSGSGWIIIRSAAPDSSLPAVGSRITPNYANVLPKIVTPNDQPAMTAGSGAHHYRFIGVEFSLTPANKGVFSLIRLEVEQGTLAQLPHDLIFDRVYVHGTPNQTVRRGIQLNSASTAVIDSYISDCHEVGADSQAIAGWGGPGPFKIVNNYLEGAGENMLFGGADPDIANLVPSDIEFRRNLCSKPLSWKVGEPNYAGNHWQVKNLLELKNAQRVLIDGNTFEYNWADAQNGFAILFTVRNQSGSAPWSVVQDVTFTNNIVRHSGCGVNVSGSDDAFPSAPTKRVKISNNLFDDIDGSRWGDADGRWLQFVGGPINVVVDHNTSFQSANIAIADGSPPSQAFIFRNNITPHNLYGFFGSDKGIGNSALDYYFPGAVFVKNVIVGGPSDSYPANNFFPPTMDAAKFVDRAGGNYRLSSSSPYKKAGTDGKDIGVDFDSLNASLNGITSVSSVSAASYSGDLLAIDSISAAFGSDLADSTQTATTVPLPTELGGVTVKIKDSTNSVWPCPLFFVSPTQINYQIPSSLVLGGVTVMVSKGNTVIAQGQVQAARVSPGLFTTDSSGRGIPTAVALRVRGATQSFESIARFDATQNKFVAIPIDLGLFSDQVYLVLYGTGIRYRSSISSTVVKIGGLVTEVTFAGAQGTFTGLDQINVRIPRSLAGRGDVGVELTVDGQAANIVQVNIK